MQDGCAVRHVCTKQLPCCRCPSIRPGRRKVAPCRRSQAVPRTVELSDGVVNSVHADSLRTFASGEKSFMTVASPESQLAHRADPDRAGSGRPSQSVARTVKLSDGTVNGVHAALLRQDDHREWHAYDGYVTKSHPRRAGFRTVAGLLTYGHIEERAPDRAFRATRRGVLKETAGTVRDDDFGFSLGGAGRAPARR
jgi:hypothetical protein